MNLASPSLTVMQDSTSQDVLRLLIVDDEPRFRQAYRTLLAAPERHIEECADGQEAMARLAAGDIDVVILDLGLPDISGLEITSWLKQKNIRTSVIIFSAATEIDSAIHALRRGVFEFIRKQASPSELISAVERALERRRIDREHGLMAVQLRHSERLHRFLVEKSPDLIYTVDTDGFFSFVNPRIESMLGYLPQELVGQHYSLIVFPEDIDKAHRAFQERRSSDRATSNMELRLACKPHGARYFEHRHIVAMVSAQGIYSPESNAPRRLLGCSGVARDITERKRAEETINYQAMHDLLTGLPNRMLFIDRLNLTVAQAQRHDERLAVLYIDVDRFKLVNDTYGHHQGDVMLMEIARRIGHCLRPCDTLARQGGDEFTVCLAEIHDPEEVNAIVQKILSSLRRPYSLGVHEFSGTSSIGIAHYPAHGESADALIRSADIAMYQAKMRGKNGCIEFDPSMNSTHLTRLWLENDLRQALREGGQFQLHYQPQVSISQRKVVGIEALIRWDHPQRGRVSPDEFIFLAEETGQIVAISDWVMQAGCAQLRRLHDQGHHDLKLGINLSPVEFERPDLLERILAPVSQHGLPRAAIDIEITENLLMHDAEGIIGKVQQLRQAGLKVSIDDFGTRYSSLNYLRRFPVSCIKIDQSFVRDMAHGQDARAIIQAIAGIAQSFGIHLLAEGIETPEQLAWLQDMGCDEMQGYYFSRPLAADALEDFLAGFSADAFGPR